MIRFKEYVTENIKPESDDKVKYLVEIAKIFLYNAAQGETDYPTRGMVSFVVSKEDIKNLKTAIKALS